MTSQIGGFFRRWVSQIASAAAELRQIAIDGKTTRGSADGARRQAYISSAFYTDILTREGIVEAIRKHWAVENKFHWTLVVNFDEDKCIVKKDNTLVILTLILCVVINMLSLNTKQTSFIKKKISTRQKRKFVIWDVSIMHCILGIQLL